MPPALAAFGVVGSALVVAAAMMVLFWWKWVEAQSALHDLKIEFATYQAEVDCILMKRRQGVGLYPEDRDTRENA